MSVLSAHDIIVNLRANGCPENRAVAWAAVSLAESSWDTEAISPTGARGLYQIEPYSWPAAAPPFSQWDVPGVNTYAAMLLSGFGANFAPWDTAYANIGASGRYTFLNWPEDGSAAAKNMSYVIAVLGSGVGGSYQPPQQPGISGTLPDALSWFAAATNQVVPHLSGESMMVAARYRRLYR